MPAAPLKEQDVRADVGSVSVSAPPEVRDGFHAWLPTRLALRVEVVKQHGQWYATATEFSLAGVGLTQADAIRDMNGLVGAYLHSQFVDGRSYENAVESRAANREDRALRVLVASVVGAALRRLGLSSCVELPFALR